MGKLRPAFKKLEISHTWGLKYKNLLWFNHRTTRNFNPQNSLMWGIFQVSQKREILVVRRLSMHLQHCCWFSQNSSSTHIHTPQRGRRKTTTLAWLLRKWYRKLQIHFLSKSLNTVSFILIGVFLILNRLVLVLVMAKWEKSSFSEI